MFTVESVEVIMLAYSLDLKFYIDTPFDKLKTELSIWIIED